MPWKILEKTNSYKRFFDCKACITSTFTYVGKITMLKPYHYHVLIVIQPHFNVPFLGRENSPSQNLIDTSNAVQCTVSTCSEQICSCTIH